jgi:acyl-CoA thioesterase
VESGGQYFVGVFGGNVVSVALKTLFHLIWFVKESRQFYFSAVCKNNAAVG